MRLRTILKPALLVFILGAAAVLRFNDLDWDQSRHLHPDERYVTVLASMLKPPSSVNAFFDSGASTLNPFNIDWGRSYVYGTLPLFTVRYIGEFMNSGCGPTASPVPLLLGRVLFGAAADSCPAGFYTGYDMMALLGRIWSGLTDLMTIFVLYLIGRRLFGWRTALLAAAFSALAVLQIQQAHFFTVDSTATLFVTLTLYFCARMVTVASRQSAPLLVDGLLAGLAAGCALASKVSVWPLIPLIVLSAVVALARNRSRGIAPVAYAFAALVLAGISTFTAFRIAQPYAFVGNSASEFQLTLQQCAATANSETLYKVCKLGAALPDPIRAVVAPSSRWIQQLVLSQGFVNGTIDVPFGHQWANRTPIVFPLINLVFWGLGIPLGLSACIGLLYGTRQLLRGRRWWAYLIPVVWGGLYFLYQSTQWTKSMRYLLPIYPMFCLLAAVWLMAVWRRAQSREHRAENTEHRAQNTERRTENTEYRAQIGVLRPKSVFCVLCSVLSALRSVLSALLIPAALVGTLVWALAFSSIYSQPITRVTASRWMFENIPTAVTAEWQSADGTGPTQTQLPVKELSLYPGAIHSLQLNPLVALTDTQSYNLALTLNHVSGGGTVRARLIDVASNQVSRQSEIVVNTQNATFHFPDVRLGRTYAVEFESAADQPIAARTSIVANEHWDDAVPQPIDGKDAYGAYYNGLRTSSDGQIQNYGEDIPEKLPQVLDWLDEADYLVMSSNRLYASIPRLPWRFPMTTEYYRAMFNGELGFELLADFNSFPRLGALKFNDQEMPQRLRRESDTQGTPQGIEVPYPTAEEAFSVYDHPRVLIFRKTSAYSRALAEQVLGKYDLTRAIQQTPLTAANTPGGMVFDAATREAQQAGGTWSELFPRSSPLNQSPALAVLAWLVLVEAIGLVAFPILAIATHNKRAAGLHPSSFTLHPLADGGYSFAKILGLLLVAFAAWWLASTKVAMFTAAQVWAVIAGLIAVGAVVWIRYRRELVQLVRARGRLIAASEIVFLAGFGLWLLVRMGNPDLWHPYMGGEKPMDFAYLNAILKSSYFPPIDPWFSGGYINYYYFGNLVVGAPIKALGIDPAIAYNIVIPTLFGLTACGAFGLAASFFLNRGSETRARRAIVAGVLAAIFAVGVGNWGQPDVIFPAWQKLGGIDQGASQFTATIDGFLKWLGGAPLPIYPNWPYWNPTRLVAAVPIAEFPQFTFLYADLHAHMMAMPIACLAVAFAIAFAAGARKWLAIALGALVVGALWPANSWDYPVYLALCLGAIIVGEIQPGQANTSSWPRRVIGTATTLVVFVALTRAFYVPYLENYGSAYNAVEPWLGERTPLKPYTLIYGVFLIPLVFYLVWGAWQTLNRRSSPERIPGMLSRQQVLGGAAAGTLSLLVAAYFAWRGVPIAAIAMPMLTLALLAALMPGTRGPTRVLWLMTSGAFTLTLFVELFTLRGDIGRMNTLFKFYIQAWLLLSVAAAVATTWQVIRMPRFRPLFIAAVTGGLLVAAMYPAFAIPAKIGDRYTRDAPIGLDGMAYMTTATRFESVEGKAREFPLIYDYQAIRWMQDNVKGSPTLIEGTTGGNLYRWGNRFSIYTGLPSVVGWQWHQRQQRAALDDRIVYDRDLDLTNFYGTSDIGEALKLIRRYDARYIILGDLERVYYPEGGFAKFDELVRQGYLRVAYQNPGTTIYEVVRTS